MGLTTKREDLLKKMPQIETKLSRSKDGKYLIHKTVITSVRPVNYYEAVIAGEEVAAAAESGEGVKAE